MAAVNNFYDEELTLQTVLGSTLGASTWGSAGSAVVAGSSLTASTKYLIIAKCVWGGTDTGTVFGCRVSTADDTDIATRSEARVEPTYAVSDQMLAYQFVWSYTTDASPADIEFQVLTDDSGEDVYIDQASILLIDLADLGSDNYVEATDAGGAGLGTTSWGNTMASIASGSLTGSTEYLVLGYAQILVDDNKTNYHIRLRGDLDADNALEQLTNHSAEGEDTSELRPSGFAGRVLTAASPSVGIEVNCYADTANDYDEGVSYLIAIDTSAFEDFEYTFSATGETIDDTAVYTIASVDSYTPSTAGDHLIIGRANYSIAGTWGKIAAEVEVDATPIMAGDIDAYQTLMFDSTDAEQFYIIGVESLTAASHDTDFNATVHVQNTTSDTEYEFLCLLSLELASTGTDDTATPAAAAFTLTSSAVTLSAGVTVEPSAAAFTLTVPAATADAGNDDSILPFFASMIGG